MRYVSHYAVHRPREIDFVLIVHGHTYQKLGLSCCDTDVLSQLVATDHKVIRVACDSRVSHMRELSFVSPRQETV